METTNSEYTENQSLIEALNTILIKSSTHTYIDSFLNKDLTDEVIQRLKKERPGLNSTDKESIITELLEEFQRELRQNISVAFAIKMIDKIDKEIDEVKCQNNDNINTLKIRASEISNDFINNKNQLDKIIDRLAHIDTLVAGVRTEIQNYENSLRGLEDRVTDRVRGSLTDNLLKVGELNTSIKELQKRIPIGLPGRREFWTGIISIIGVFASVWMVSDSSLNRTHTSTLEMIKINNSNLQELVKTKIESLEKSILNLEKSILNNQRLQRVEDK